MTNTDLLGRRYVITGANTGVGRATAEALTARGAEVVLACRSAERAAAVLAQIAAGPGRGELVPLDLASLTSVRRAADAIGARPIDALINNAGVGGARGLSEDGFELAFGVNHLGHYLLTRLLLERADVGRVVHVSSGSHRHARGVDFDAVRRPTKTLTGVREYAVSKLCGVLFHHELARRGVASHAADPGDVASEAYRHAPWPVRKLLTMRAAPPAQGARTSVHCATQAIGPGGFWVDERPLDASPTSKDEDLARVLWERSAEWTGLDRRRVSA